jgi:hypothetical protein
MCVVHTADALSLVPHGAFVLSLANVQCTSLVRFLLLPPAASRRASPHRFSPLKGLTCARCAASTASAQFMVSIRRSWTVAKPPAFEEGTISFIAGTILSTTSVVWVDSLVTLSGPFAVTTGVPGNVSRLLDASPLALDPIAYGFAVTCCGVTMWCDNVA